MDANSALCLTGGIVFFLRKLLRIRLKSVSAVLIPSGCGKTSILKYLEAPKDTIMIDLDATSLLSISEEQERRLKRFKDNNESQSYKQEIMIICRDYVKKLKRDFLKKKIILISSSYDILKYLGLSSEDINVYCPNNQLFTEICETNKERSKEMSDNRTEILLQAGKNIRGIYASYNELYNLLIRDFGLKNKL